MATGKSGSFSGSSSNGGYTLKIDWIEYYDVSSNTSTISWKAYLVTKSGYDIYVSSKSGSITIDGTKYNFTASVSNGGGATTLLAQGTSNKIWHNADGTKSINMSAQWASGISACGTLNASGSAILTTIPRASSVSASEYVYMGNTCTISVSRASTSFTHWIYASFEGSAYVCIAENVGTSYSWVVPLSYADKIPNSDWGTCTIKCVTWTTSGSDWVWIGESTTTCYLYVPNYSVTVSHTLTPKDQHSNKYVATKSKVQVQASATTLYKATIKSYSTVVGNQAAQSGATITSNPLSAGTVAITTTVTDSRGHTGKKTTNISVVPYSNPYCTALHAARDETNSEKVIVTAKFGVSPIENTNSISAVITVAGSSYPVTVSGYTYDGTVILNGINDEVLLTGTLTVTDIYGSTAAEFAIPTLEAIMNFKSNHKGVAFGGVSQTDRAVEMYWKLLLQDAENNQMVDVLSQLNILDNRDYTTSSGNSGNLKYIKRSDGLLICYGQIEYSKKNTSAWGSWYYIELGTFAYPVAFISTPVCLALPTAGYGGTICFDGTTNGSKSRTPGLYIIRPTSASNANGEISLLAIGKWK